MIDYIIVIIPFFFAYLTLLIIMRNLICKRILDQQTPFWLSSLVVDVQLNGKSLKIQKKFF